MKFMELKENDLRFDHRAGDLFILQQADYDDDKYVGFKIILQPLDNSFYKSQMRGATFSDIREIAESMLEGKAR